MKAKEEKIRLRILVPLGLTILTLLIVSILCIYRLQEQWIEESTKMRLSAVQKAFELKLKKNAELFNGLIDLLEQVQRLQAAWLAKDRDGLLRLCTPFLKDIFTDHRVSHFCFHSLEEVCFLCVHDFPRRDDNTERYILNQAKREGQPACGIELGPLGTFTLRVVHPWRIDGEIVGYIEFGEEIGHIIPELKRVVGADLFFTVNKSYLNRGRWEKGLQVTGHGCQWDQFASFVIMHHTMEKVPPELNDYLEGLGTCTEQKHLSCLLEMSLNSRHYSVGFLPLIIANGQEVGEIIVLTDVTKEKASRKTLSMVLVVFCIVISALLFAVLYLYIGRIERRLTGAYSALRTEVENRKLLEKEILDVSEREQRRIGQELHNSIGQQFVGVAFMAKVLQQRLSGKLPEEAESAAQIARLVNQGMEKARDLAKGLHPVDLDGTNLTLVLQELAATTEYLFGVRCTFSSDGCVAEVDTEVAVHLYRITQEAIINAIKHGRAKNIHITLAFDHDKSVLTAKNDGLDFPEEITNCAGMGLNIMKHRAEIIDGFLDVRRHPKSGTILTCVFPNKSNGDRVGKNYVSEKTTS
jgi:signal transduction histidine kinase